MESPSPLGGMGSNTKVHHDEHYLQRLERGDPMYEKIWCAGAAPPKILPVGWTCYRAKFSCSAATLLCRSKFFSWDTLPEGLGGPKFNGVKVGPI